MFFRFACSVLVCQFVFVSKLPNRPVILIHTPPLRVGNHSKAINIDKIYYRFIIYYSFIAFGGNYLLWRCGPMP